MPVSFFSVLQWYKRGINMKNMIEVMDQARTEVLDEIENSQDPRIKRALNAFRKAVDNEDLFKRTMKQFVPAFMEFADNMSDIDEKTINEFIADTLRNARHDILEMSKQFVLRCEADQEGAAGAYRVLSIPASYSWAALGYHILAAFGCTDTMRFKIEHDDEMYGPMAGFDDEYGDMIEDGHGFSLFEDDLRKGSKAVLSFSGMEGVTINCRIIRTIPAKTVKANEIAQLLDGEGEGPFADPFDLEERKMSLDKRAADLLDQFEAQFDRWDEDEYNDFLDPEMMEYTNKDEKLKNKMDELRKKLEKEKTHHS